MRLEDEIGAASPATADAAEPTVYQLILPTYVRSLPLTWAFVGLASAIFAVLGHPLVALITAATSGAADYALHRLYKRWQTVAHTVSNRRGMTQLGAWVMARSAWNLAVPAGMALITHQPSDIVFALLMAGGMLLLAVIQAVYSTRLYVMAVIPPIAAGLAAVAAVQSRPQDLALFGALLWIDAMLLFIGITARGIAARERASRADKNRMIAELQVAVENANREKREADEAREAARKAALAKSTFLATMSHEIRTPLNGVLGMAQALERSRLSTIQRGQVATIATSGEMLMLVLNDVLDLCEMEAGKLEIAKTPCELAGLLDEMMGFWSNTAQDRGLHLTLRVDDGLPAYLMFDGARVRQILFNLVGNAIKFTEAGGVLIVVRAAEENGALKLYMEVTDTGIGISPTALGGVFEAFSQGDPTDRRRYTGAGMGLAISKQLSLLMDGDVTVKSRPGEGATFRLTL
ncbi:MAG TPA: ATP-binding protein, partial [Phenylobacterium sp.]